ncbi:unnamed protein product [Fusarium equiseti]|uniref:Choline transport protein n=1 Tax=Fusarium equiseti TaxID=61235 RepID=A0A8J2IS57_FUSEQ|nr:unnamed protein product [Fusarium equiseti]
MDGAKDDHGATSPKRSMDISVPKAEMNADELRLAQMGHTQELNRHFSTLSLIGLASTTTISWTGLGLGLITEIGAGGPGAVIYGFILVTILQCFLGASLAEFVSSYPTEGGMYHWIAAVAPRRTTGILSFLTGWFSVLGWIFTTASTNIIYAQILMALIALYTPDLEIKAWQTFIVYECLNLLTAGVVMFGNKIIPALNRFSLFYLQIGWLVVLITVVACAPTHRDPEFVFRTWINKTGWKNNAICFITGLVNPLYSLGGLDGVTHITEEMPNPSRNAPLAIAITLVIAFCTGITYLISLMFSIQDFDQLTSANTGMPLAELFRQVTQRTGGAFGLLFILFIALGPCVISSQLSTGRVFWAFSRDGAMPFSKVWSKVHSSLKMPFNAQLAVTAVIAALGCLYLGSSTAFNSLLGTAVTINNISYMFPILTNLITGRKNMHKGVFHMGRTIGPIVNAVTVCWLTFAIIFFSFPYVMSVEAANMNYTCVVVGGLAILIGGWWFKWPAPSTEKGSVLEPLIESESGNDTSGRNAVSPIEPSHIETPEDKGHSGRKGKRRMLPVIGHLALVHLPPVAITLAVLSLYITNVRWSNPTNNALNALQFAAKIHEALIIVSIGDILMGRINHHLLQNGNSLPLGYLPSPFLLNSPFLYLISSELWAPIRSSRGRHGIQKVTGAVILLSALLCIAASPLSAITMIPRQGWRLGFKGYGQPSVMTTYNPSALYNNDLVAKAIPDQNYTHFSMSLIKPSQNSMLETTLTRTFSRHSEPLTNVTYSNYEATYRHMSLKAQYYGAVATCPLSAVARNFKISAYGSFVSNGLTKARNRGGDSSIPSKWKQPLVSTQCVPIQLRNGTDTISIDRPPFFNGTVEIDSAQHPWMINVSKSTSNSAGPLGYGFLNLKDTQKLKISTDIIFASIVNETEGDDGYPVPLRPAVIHFTLCLISARWAEAELWVETGGSSAALSHFSFDNGEEAAKIGESFGTEDFINIHDDWMAGIASPPNTIGNISSYEEAMYLCIKASYLGFLRKTRVPGPLTVDPNCLQRFLAMHVTDALAELGGFREFQKTNSIGSNEKANSVVYTPSDVDVDFTTGKASQKWTKPVFFREVDDTGRMGIGVRSDGDDMD